MFRSSKKQSRTESTKPALFNLLNDPTRAPPSRSHSAGSEGGGALERILRGESNYDPNHTPVIKSGATEDLEALTKAFHQAQLLDALVNGGEVGAHGKRRKHRKTPRRTKSDDGSSSVVSRMSTGSRKSTSSRRSGASAA
ncbi:expressed unknown protein [Seminavis robusta]|uniref:Uncharacterized protein n=1 Tax=Seminavis robusta TaxID=568900 RepID=A0A9N8HKA7_9STRA|nr:expressed unknown protein [Seminavis robusta]|eukprot:Sro742_g195910.1 n/a (140) ;mRNA; r:21274-21693